MKKKLVAGMMSAMMVASLLTGCGSSDSGSAGSTATDSSTSTETGSEAAAGEADSGVTKTAYGEYTEENPYQLTFAYLEFYTQDEAARAAVQDAINAKLVPELHIEVELLPLQPADYQSKVQMMLSGGDKLDVFPIQSTLASSWINMGGIYDMSEFMDSAEGKAVENALGDSLAHAGTVNGILYGFPANKEYVELGGLCMRADICDELGITEEYGLEKNKDEYDGKIYDWSVAGDIFAKVKEAYPDMIPLYLQGSSSQMNRFIHVDQLGDNFGVIDWEADQESTTVVNKFETDTYKNTITMLANWYDKGYIFKDAQTDTSGSATMMKAGNTFSYVTAIKPGFLVEAAAANGMDCYAMYFGTGVESDRGTESVLFTGNACLYNTGIANNSEDPEMAFKFISALYSDSELMNLWQYGIQDVNYKLNDDGTIYFADGEDGSNYKYHQNTGWSMGNQMISYVWSDGSKSADYWDKLQTHNDWGVVSKTFGFNWDSTQYSTQITALSNALSTYRAALETGSVGAANVESTLKELNDALYAAGLQDVMDAKQVQLDEWLAK